MVNWGILGCGKIASKFAQDLATVTSATLYAVGSRHLQKANAFRKIHGAMKYYGSYLELIQDAEVDIIYIATPHVFHYEHTIQCLTYKKAVLCEKPLAMKLQQVQKMIALAKEKNTFLMEGLWTYFLPHYKYVLNCIASQELGEIISLEADFGFKANFDPTNRLFNKNLGGGSLLDIGIYPLFAALTLLGYPKKIEASATIGTTNIDEECTMQLEYPNGKKALLHSSLISNTSCEAKITCTKGNILIHHRFHAPTSISITQNNVTKTLNFPTSTHGYNFEIEHIHDMLSQHRIESTVMTFDTSLQLMELLDTIRDQIGLKYAEEDKT